MAEEQTAGGVSWRAMMDEVEQLVARLEEDDVPLEELGPTVERATTLLKQSRLVLREAELRVQRALDTLEEDEDSP